ncbi:MAG: hydrogenase iron-sulfur subunit [Desulfotomaculaceae bacterium]|nr:hydrogenase iron-sulfur subunit [Desulfotomaculaceae bacterium]
MSKHKFVPKMLGIVCNWCCYGGADLCGVSRFQYPPYIKLMRVMCSGRVSMEHVFRAFSNGADGVFIGGCHPGDCHYITHGNYDALSMALICKKVMKHIGINPERLRIDWVSAGEGIRFANIMNEYSRKIENLGPLGIAEALDQAALEFKIEAVTKIIPYIKVVERQRLRIPVRSEEAVIDFFNSEEFNRLFDETIAEKLAISQIGLLLREGALTSGEIAKALDLTPSVVSRYLNISLMHGFVRYEESRKRFAIS